MWVYRQSFKSLVAIFKSEYYFDMKLKRYFALFGIVTGLWAAEPCQVKFIVKYPAQLPATTIFITGNHTLLGNWNPGAIALDRTDDYYAKVLTFPAGTKLEYKFTLGSWEKEAASDNGEIFANFRLTVTGDTILSYTFNNWTHRIRQPVVGHILGQVEYLNNLSGDGLKARDVVVWLPPDYNENPQKRYPVLYMHDGQNLFSARTAGYGAEWRLDEIADSLITAGCIRPLIIVGIYNTSDRSQEYGTGKMGLRYRDFVISTVKPLIDQRYRTIPDRELTVTGGSSMGGLVSFILLWENPDVFSKAICMSPAFQIDTLDYVRIVKNHPGKPPAIKIYIDNGGIDLENELQPGIDAMLNSLTALGFRPDCDYYWVKDPQAAHNETAWSRRIAYPLQLFFRP